jgi:two-component system, chemotaxis family, sensor histidine kinase and response regulator PixL
LRLTEEELIPIYRLSEILDYSDFSELEEDRGNNSNTVLPLLILRCMGQTLALEVDRVIGEQELVIRPFSKFINVASYVYGGSILADVGLTLAIDASTLLTQFLETRVNAAIEDNSNHLTPTRSNSLSLVTSSNSANNSQKNANSGTLVKLANSSFSFVHRERGHTTKNNSQLLLVVDDSVTLRQTLAMTLQKEGYQVLQARDGYEAISQLQQNPRISLIVCDVEMPRMNGYEFLAHRSNDARLQQIPVMILSSRTALKHRQLALNLKVSRRKIPKKSLKTTILASFY